MRKLLLISIVAAWGCERGGSAERTGPAASAAAAAPSSSPSSPSSPTPAAPALAVGSAIDIPTVACPRDGQLGPQKTKAPATTKVIVTKALASIASPETALRVYTTGDLTALAPAGWTCGGSYGSSGSSLEIGPTSADLAPKVSGEAVRILSSMWGTSGRVAAGRIGARLMPSLRPRAAQIDKELDMPPPVTSPWPGELSSLDGKVARYTDPPKVAGTADDATGLKPSAIAVTGSVKDTADALNVIAIRLAPPRDAYAEAIRDDFEKR